MLAAAGCLLRCAQGELLAELEGELFDLRDQLAAAAGERVRQQQQQQQQDWYTGHMQCNTGVVVHKQSIKSHDGSCYWCVPV
jgi:hypothetical protein